jgi:hypothetical protein
VRIGLFFYWYERVSCIWVVNYDLIRRHLDINLGKIDMPFRLGVSVGRLGKACCDIWWGMKEGHMQKSLPVLMQLDFGE